MRRHLTIAAAFTAMLLFVPIAAARVIGPQPRQGGCPAASGTAPTMKALKLGTTDIPVDPSDGELNALAVGSLYATTGVSCQTVRMLVSLPGDPR